jgi:hypothetical protein
MNARSLILICSFFIFGKALAHPIHVSVVNLDYSSDSNRINLSIRLFYDDFQSLINYKYNTILDFKKSVRMTSKEQQAIISYIHSSFVITDQNNNDILTEFTGWKVEDVSVWLYFCAKTEPGFQLTQLKNVLMLELFTDQKNLVITHLQGNEQGFEFDKRDISLRINQ